MERALNVINYLSEQEKLNLWLAYINFEYTFGDESQLIIIFQRALKANDPYEIYKRMIELYKTGKNWAMVAELSSIMVKKFRLKKEAWKFYIGCELERSKEQ